jgi:hypothetical protein
MTLYETIKDVPPTAWPEGLNHYPLVDADSEGGEPVSVGPAWGLDLDGIELGDADDDGEEWKGEEGREEEQLASPIPEQTAVMLFESSLARWLERHNNTHSVNVRHRLSDGWEVCVIRCRGDNVYGYHATKVGALAEACVEMAKDATPPDETGKKRRRRPRRPRP